MNGGRDVRTASLKFLRSAPHIVKDFGAVDLGRRRLAAIAEDF